MSQDFLCDIETLETWANERGFSVLREKNGDDSICHISKSISINSSSKLEQQLYKLAHECGHLLIYKNGGHYSYEKSLNDDDLKTFDSRTLRILEESEAWEKGYKLCKRLKIEINKEKWDSLVVQSIGKYIVWANKLKIKNRSCKDEDTSKVDA